MTIIQWAGSPVHSFRILGSKVHLPKTTNSLGMSYVTNEYDSYK